MAKKKATFGQQLLGIQFEPHQLTDTKIALFHILTVGADYVQSKVESPSKNYLNNVNPLPILI